MALGQDDCGRVPWADSWAAMAIPICLRLFWQLMRLAASRAFCTAGISWARRTAMMAITTSSSIRVNALRTPDFGNESMVTALSSDTTRNESRATHPSPSVHGGGGPRTRSLQWNVVDLPARLDGVRQARLVGVAVLLVNRVEHLLHVFGEFGRAGALGFVRGPARGAFRPLRGTGLGFAV